QIMEKIAARATASGSSGPASASGASGASDAGTVTAADIDAVLNDLGPPDSPQRLAAAGFAPRPAHHGGEHLSFAALAGAIWAMLFFIMLALSSIQLEVKPGQPAPLWQRPEPRREHPFRITATSREPSRAAALPGPRRS